MTVEEHARDFLDYVAKNEKKLKHNLKKNITYNPDIFEDVYADTIVKIYNYIINKKKYIQNFENFFFMCSKNNYINLDNKTKKAIISSKNDFFDNIENGHEKREYAADVEIYNNYMYATDEAFERDKYLNNVNELFKFIAQRIEEEFTPAEADIYIIYSKLKSEKERISYQKFAKITGRSVQFISEIISKINKFVNADTKILNKKKELLYD